MSWSYSYSLGKSIPIRGTRVDGHHYHIFAGSGHEGMVKILLKQGDVNSDSSDKDGRTPLTHAVRSGHEGIVKILLGRGDVNPDSLDDFSRTPLSFVAESRYVGIVKILLERGDVSSDSLDEFIQ